MQIHETVLAKRQKTTNTQTQSVQQQITQQQRKVYNNNKKGNKHKEQGLKVSFTQRVVARECYYIETPKQKILVRTVTTIKPLLRNGEDWSLHWWYSAAMNILTIA